MALITGFDPGPAPNLRRRSSRRWRWFLLGVLLAPVIVTYAPLHRWEDEYVVWERNEAGVMARQGDDGLALLVRLATCEGDSDKQLVSHAHSRGAPPSGFACKRVWLLNLSGERLCREIALALQDQLRELDFVQEVAYFPRSYLPLHDATLPDVLVTIDLADSRERVYPGWHELHHVLEIGVGRRPLGFELDPVSFRTSQQAQAVVTLDYRCKGLVSAGSRHSVAVEALVERLDLPQIFADWRREFGAAPGSPEELIEEERARPDLPLPRLAGLRTIYEGGQFLVHNETLWLAPVGASYQEVLHSIQGDFLADGWALVDSLPWRVALRKGPLYFEAFRSFQALPTRQQEDFDLGLFYQHRYTAEEAHELLARHLEQEGGSENSERFQRFVEHVYPGFRGELLEHLAAHPIDSMPNYTPRANR